MSIVIYKQRRRIIVSIYDARLLYRVVELLRSLGLVFQGLYLGVDTCTRGILIADKEGLEYARQVCKDIRMSTLILNSDTVEGTVFKAMVLSMLENDRIHTLVAGIDYGKSIGVALLADGVIVYVGKFRLEDEALNTLSQFFKSVEASKKIVRVGIPSTIISKSFESFIEKLNLAMPSDVIIELVPEVRSNKPNILLFNDRISDEDISAALNIALRSGSNT